MFLILLVLFLPQPVVTCHQRHEGGGGGIIIILTQKPCSFTLRASSSGFFKKKAPLSLLYTSQIVQVLLRIVPLTVGCFRYNVSGSSWKHISGFIRATDEIKLELLLWPGKADGVRWSQPAAFPEKLPPHPPEDTSLL